MKAAVCRAAGAELVVEDLDLADPGPGEVLVRIDAAGICHSDYHYLTGDLACPMPVVPGHEGAGVVAAVGDGVSAVRPGDTVCLMWRPRYGQCRFCLTGGWSRVGVRCGSMPPGCRASWCGCAATANS